MRINKAPLFSSHPYVMDFEESYIDEYCVTISSAHAASLMNDFFKRSVCSLQDYILYVEK